MPYLKLLVIMEVHNMEEMNLNICKILLKSNL